MAPKNKSRGTETPPDESVLEAALNLLSFRARSVGEIRDRLLKKDLDRDAVSYCIRWLETRGYLDDRSFATALAKDRFRFSPRSPFFVQRELREKLVSGPVAEDAVQSVLDEEGLTAADLARTAAGQWVRDDDESETTPRPAD